MTRLLRSLALVGLAMLFAAPLAAQPVVRDSVRMTRQVFYIEGHGRIDTNPDGSQSYQFNCWTGVIATWPDVLAELGLPGGYGRYGRVVASYPDATIPGNSEATRENGMDFPAGHVGHHVYTVPGTFVYQLVYLPNEPDRTNCYSRRAQAQAAYAASPPWYAVFSVPDGTPVSLYEWEQTEGLDVAFDGSFESHQAHEADVSQPSGKRPVVSYAWDFGDGQTGSGAAPTHTYARADTFAVRLTVTDDDGQTNDHVEQVVVTPALLSVEVRTETTPVEVGDEFSLVAIITNTGNEPVYSVSVAPYFFLIPSFPEALSVPGNQFRAAGITRIGAATEIREAVLEPGQRIEVRQRYRVDSGGTVQVAGGAEQPVETRLKPTLPGITGTTESGDPANLVDTCKAGGCQDVTVVKGVGPALARRIVIDVDTVRTRDTLVVRVEVRNTGTEDLHDVVPGEAPTVNDVDAGAFDSERVVDPRLEAVGEGPEPESVDVLAPDETATFEYRLRVAVPALFSDPDDGGQFSPIPATVTFQPGAGASGTFEGNPVLAENDCGGEPCRADVVVAPLDVRILLQAYVENTAVAEGAAVKTGLSYSVLTERATFYAGTDLEGGCASGCVEIGVEVRESGEPMAHEPVWLDVPEVTASDDVTARPHGNWFVATAEQTGGAPAVDAEGRLRVTTDTDGRASALYFTPGVTENTPITVKAFVEGEAEGIGLIGPEEELDLVLVPNKPITRSFDVDPITTAYLRTLAAVVQASATGNAVGDYCENGVKWLRANAPLIGDGALDGGGSLRRDATLYLSNLGVNFACGYILGRVGDGLRNALGGDLDEFDISDVYAANRGLSFVDLFAEIDEGSGSIKKFAQSHLFLYLLYRADLGGRLLGVALPSPEPPPVYASFQGDFVDTSLDHLTSVMAAAPAGASYHVDLDFYELSALDARASLTRPEALLHSTMRFTPTGGGGAEQTFSDRARYLYDPDIFLDTAPDGLTDLQETITLIGGAIPAAVGEAAVDIFDGITETLSGAVVQIGDQLQFEINQILAVRPSTGGRLAGGGEETVTLTFASPTLYAYPEGTPIRVLAQGETGPPAAPIPLPSFVPASLVKMEWMPGAAVASSYDVEVATDTLFAEVVYEVTATRALGVELTEAEVSRDRILYWHVRGTNAAGDGDWSQWLPILVNDRPTAGEDAPRAVPAAVALGMPFPNPARSASATVSVEMPEAGPARLAVYDALGREVAVALDGTQAAGRHLVALDTSRLPSGVYVVRLEAGDEVAVQRLTVVR